MTTVRARAFAKLNLGLRILGRRRDGYHELRSVLQTISLADTLTLTFRPGRGVRLEAVRAAPGVCWPELADGQNLAVRAALLAREEFGLRGQIGVALHKRIPLGAGLGGGSADAAAVLRVAAAQARRPPPAAALYRLAAALGSDVPALLLGGTVLALGRGEECYRLPDLPAWYCLLAAPAGVAVATAEAYARWDRLHAGRSAGLTAEKNSVSINCLLGSLRRTYAVGSVRRAYVGGSRKRAAPASRPRRDRGPAQAEPRVRAGIENDFHEAVFPLSPDFLSIRRALGRAGAVWVSLSGSGAAQYGLFTSRAAAEAARAVLPASAHAWTARFVRPRDEFCDWGVVQR